MPIWNPDEEVLKQTAKAVKAGEEVDPSDRIKCFDLCQLYMAGYGDIKADPVKAYRYFIDASNEYSLYGYDKDLSLSEDGTGYYEEPADFLHLSVEGDDLVVTVDAFDDWNYDGDRFTLALEPVHVPLSSLSGEGPVFLLLPVHGDYHADGEIDSFDALLGIAVQKVSGRWRLAEFFPSDQEICERLLGPLMERVCKKYGPVFDEALRQQFLRRIRDKFYIKIRLHEDCWEYIREKCMPSIEADACKEAQLRSGDWLTTRLNSLYPSDKKLKQIAELVMQDQKPDALALCQLMTFGSDEAERDPELACRFFRKASGGSACIASYPIDAHWELSRPGSIGVPYQTVRCTLRRGNTLAGSVDFLLPFRVIDENLVRCGKRDLAFFLGQINMHISGDIYEDVTFGLLIEKGDPGYYRLAFPRL